MVSYAAPAFAFATPFYRTSRLFINNGFYSFGSRAIVAVNTPSVVVAQRRGAAVAVQAVGAKVVVKQRGLLGRRTTVKVK
jgi:hypothetical protein